MVSGFRGVDIAGVLRQRRRVENASQAPRPLPPTSAEVTVAEARPYFLWWTDCTVAGFRAHLASTDPDEVAYGLGALLREANTRDVWLFTTSAEVRQRWPQLLRHLGRARARWAWLLDLDGTWPPAEARGAVPIASHL